MSDPFDPLLNPRSSTGTTLLTNVLCRSRQSLDGRWRAIPDPYDTGYVNILGERNRQGYFRDFKPRSPSDRVEYDFDRSTQLEVPGDWNTQDPSLLYYEGTMWYRTVFAVTEPEVGRTFLHIEAANHTSRIFLDGDELATHVGGFGPFSVEVTGRLTTGEHSLVLQVNNRREANRIPAMRTDWWNFGGIHRSVHLVAVPDTFLRDAWLTMAPDGSLVGGATVDSGGVVGGTEGGDGSAGGDGTTVTVELPDAGIRAQLDGGRVRIDAATASTLERWRPGSPVLHRVVWTCGEDRIEDQVGFRTVRVDGNRVLVNDEETFLLGISIHGEGPSGGRRAHGVDDASTLLDWAEDLGANFVRLAHYQHDEHMLREADRRGLLAWAELPVYWGIAFGDEAVLANALAQADELVVRDRSRASAIVWSVANETLPGNGRDEFLGALVDRVRHLDDTRLTTAALLTIPSNDPVVHIEDPLGEKVDLVAINQYLGWYYGERSELPSIRFSTAFGKPIVFSELGAGARFGNRGDPDEIWTEEFQAAVYEAQIAMIRNQPDCAGMTPWILKDFRTPLRVLPGVQDGYNRKGLVSEEGERKLAFEVLRDFYRGERS